ncbi:hypothetical protein BJ170DRAFT_591468 [Xylariales sp. AK1849]|nr:hypothetical protein BJ170DRAFT_591468 [Xylariales sp. AK1849]
MVVEIPNGKDELQSPSDSSLDTLDLVLVQELRATVDEGGGQLSVPQTNRPAELSIPREIISSSVSSSILQAELLRPIIVGTYHDTPAYLVRLQFQLAVPGGSRSWLSRIQTATINVLLKDAPRDVKEGPIDDEPSHPSIVKTMPGPKGWEGKPSKAEVTENKEIGLQLGWDALSASANVGRSRKKAETGAIKVMAVRKGPQRNSLLVTVAEDPVDAAGIPEYLTIPLIITHHTRRFSMRVALNATYGFWRGKLAEMVPVLGRADEPLYFDPLVMRRMMDKGQRGTGGVKVIEWRGKLEDIDLHEYCSLTSKPD